MNTAVNGQNTAVVEKPEMADILTSIRTGVAEAGAGQLPEDDDVLELTPAEMVGGTANVADELIDLAAFGATGESKPPVEPVPDVAVAAVAAALEAPAVETPVATASDEFDRLLAEISTEKKQSAEAAELQKKALMAELDEPLDALPAVVLAPAAEPMPVRAEQPEPPVEVATGVTEPILTAATAAAQEHFQLGMVDSAQGPQIALPAEVMAMVLRPMVQGWLQANLPAIVERLVKEEISRLAQN